METPARRAVPPAVRPAVPPVPPLPPFVPFVEGVPADLPQPWVPPFLRALAQYGGDALAAAEVGIPLRTARRLRDHAAFGDEWEAALEYHADALGFGLPNSARPVGAIVQLKKFRPAQYVEKAVNVNINADAAVPAAAEALMQDFFATLDARRATMLRGEVLDVPADVIVEAGGPIEYPALPSGPPDTADGVAIS